MAFSISSIWNYGRSYCSIEHRTTSDDDVSFFSLISRKKKGEFEIKENFRTDSLSALSKSLPPGQHCHISITGSAVLVKSTTATGTDGKIISAAFPNIDVDEFYYQILKTSDLNLVALCRKDKVHDILKSYTKEKLNIIGFSLSFFSVQHLIALIDSEEVQVSNFLIRNKNSHINSFEKNLKTEEKEYSIADTSVNSQFLLPLSGLFNYETNIPDTTSNLEEKNNALRTAYLQNVFFKKAAILGAAVLFLALLVNFFLFSKFYTEYQDLEAQYQENLLQKKVMDQKTLEIKEKEQVVSNIFNNSNSSSSLYINKVISKKPSSILLKDLTFHPLEKKIKQSEPIEFNTEMIKISGESRNEVLFSEWIKDLEEITWITKVTVLNYSFLNTESSEFSLNLKIKENGAN